MGFRAWLSWVLAAETPTRRGSPFASDRMCILEPGLPRSTGLGPVRSPPLFRLDVGGVEDGSGEVEQAGVVEAVQDLLVQPAPDTGPGPDQEPAVGRGLRYAEARWHGSPGAAGDQYVDDRGEQRLIRRVLRSAALWPPLDGGISGCAISHNPSGTIQLHVPRPMTCPTAASPHRTRSKGATSPRWPDAYESGQRPRLIGHGRQLAARSTRHSPVGQSRVGGFAESERALARARRNLRAQHFRIRWC